MFGCFKSPLTDGLAPFLKPESVSIVLKSKEKGNEAYSKKNFSGAISEYNRALSAFESNVPSSAIPKAEDIHLLSTILSNRSASFLNLKKYNEAFQDAEQVIQWRPEWVKGYYRKAEVLYRKKDFINALTLYKESLQRSPSDRSLHQRVIRCKIAIEEQNKGFMIHQLLAGRDFCESSWMAPIQSVVFQFASQMKNFVYFICNTETMQCVVVDACWDIEGIIGYAKGNGMTIVGALLTHFHVDHCGGLPPPPFDKFRIRIDGLAKLLKKIPDIKAYIHANEISKVLEGNPDFPVDRISPTADQQVLQIPFDQSAQHVTKIKCIHTPGHTPGSQCFLVNEKRLISGDTLFVGSCGRTDFPESNVGQMFHSLKEKLYKLSDSIVVYPGHDYGGEFTTILREKSGGVLGMSEEQFMKVFEPSC